jgi:hypothetical protein
MNRKLTFAVVLLLLTIGLSSAATDTFTITLNNLPQTDYFGDRLSYIATVFALASRYLLLCIEVTLAFLVIKKLQPKLISIENYFIGRPECD